MTRSKRTTHMRIDPSLALRPSRKLPKAIAYVGLRLDPALKKRLEALLSSHDGVTVQGFCIQAIESFVDTLEKRQT